MNNNSQEFAQKIFDDETFKTIRDLQDKDNNLAFPMIEDVMKIIKTNLEAESDYDIMTAFNGLSKCLMFTAQALCQNEEHYKEEVDKSYKFAMDVLAPLMTPEKEEVEKVDFDHENYSLRRLMMSVSHLLSYILWRVLLTDYSKMRSEIEENENKEAVVEAEKESGDK